MAVQRLSSQSVRQIKKSHTVVMNMAGCSARSHMTPYGGRVKKSLQRTLDTEDHMNVGGTPNTVLLLIQICILSCYNCFFFKRLSAKL